MRESPRLKIEHLLRNLFPVAVIRILNLQEVKLRNYEEPFDI